MVKKVMPAYADLDHVLAHAAAATDHHSRADSACSLNKPTGKSQVSSTSP